MFVAIFHREYTVQRLLVYILRTPIIYLSVQLELTRFPVMFLLLYDFLQTLSNFLLGNVTPDHLIKFSPSISGENKYTLNFGSLSALSQSGQKVYLVLSPKPESISDLIKTGRGVRLCSNLSCKKPGNFRLFLFCSLLSPVQSCELCQTGLSQVNI